MDVIRCNEEYVKKAKEERKIDCVENNKSR